LSFIYQLLINPSSKAFDSDQIRSFKFLVRKSDKKNRISIAAMYH